SRLLPNRLWSSSYVVPTSGPNLRGWYVLFATDDPTQVTIQPSSPGDQVVAADGVTANGTGNVGINLEGALLVTALQNSDLTGTRINSNVSFAAYAGHDSASLGNNYGSTLNQALLGVPWWGTEYVVAPPASATPNMPRVHRVRVITVEANTNVSFEPDIGLDSLVPLPGNFIETPASTTQAVHITSDKPVMVVQYSSMAAQMLVAVPVEYFATDHVLSALGDWGAPNVTVVAPNSASVQVDGDFISDWFTIGASGYKSAYVPLNVGGAMRQLSSTEPVFVHVTTSNGGAWHSSAY
ncbi:MAG TPA: IgGFc-binding protein, partial [Enhygromyxa sp.]|nr:IgGFc-binding protein [Enhygromyxa sp.]